MSTQPPSAPSKLASGATVSHLHHVGHVVRDIESAIALYRRMGFVVPPPSFPALAPRPGEPVRAFGVGNTHVSLRNNFVELVTVIDDQQGGGVESDATLVPLQAPPEVLERLTDDIAQAARRISQALDRFEGLHILVFGTADADALPSNEKVNPAAPNAGMAALVTRFRFEACFTCGMSHPP